MKKSNKNNPEGIPAKKTPTKQSKFHLEFKNGIQKMAWSNFMDNDILFLSGPAGVGKSFLACAFAINSVLQGDKKKIILTRPIVESGEKLGFLPGTFDEKVHPYMMPLYDCMDKLLGKDNPQREIIDKCVEIAPLAYLRGRTFDDAVCILDEAQNTTLIQMKLFLTRLGENSKMVITGDPTQSDLNSNNRYGMDTYVALSDIIARLAKVPGIGIVQFKSDSIVRHPLVAKIVDELGEV